MVELGMASLVIKEPVTASPLLKVMSLRVHVISADAHVANPAKTNAAAKSFMLIFVLLFFRGGAARKRYTNRG
jgi:hypothetical protein